MMRIFMSSSRWRCKVSIACCAAVLVPTNLTPGCCTASQIARASVASVLLPLTKGRTIFACNSRTVCPSLLKFRAQWCVPPLAFMVTRHDLKHVFGNVQTDYLQAVHGGDDLSGAYLVLRFMADPLWLSEDLDLSHPGHFDAVSIRGSTTSQRFLVEVDRRQFHFDAPIDRSVRREASIASIRYLCVFVRKGLHRKMSGAHERRWLQEFTPQPGYRVKRFSG
jgi:hypothetical protein